MTQNKSYIIGSWDPKSENEALEAVRVFCREANLSLPPILQRFVPQLKQLREGIWGTRDVKYGLYDFATFTGELEKGWPDPYCLLGMDGHGVQSWAFHYYCVTEELALFLQIAFGGAYLDEAIVQKRLNSTFELVGQLYEGIGRLLKAERISKSKRLYVALSDFSGSGWGWIDESGSVGELEDAGPLTLFDAVMSIAQDVD